ncbi:MAG: bifunctional phosphopantothenoylcysteine decarboxylase/phosphopantothenate--cysteine ligase CoaBC [Aureispira sp.]
MSISGKKILVAISGSIAAYKMAFFVRLLIKADAEVKVVMTPSAQDFITPLTLSTLSKNEVWSDVHSGEGWNNHVDLGLWADALLVAPATANTLAKMANGLCDNLLLAVYLSSRCPVFVAPAMDLDMWIHPATQYNVHRLQGFGNHVLPPEEGELASGLVGKGRMAEPETMFKHLEQFFAAQEVQPLKGKQVLITSGATQESIDPVRFISNHSTGRMGAALASEMAQAGAQVTLVSAKNALLPQAHPNINIVPIVSANDLHQAAAQHFPNADITILAAAVADYTPEQRAPNKIKKKTGPLVLTLKRTVDVAATLGQQKNAHQLLIGFALETTNALENAVGKLQRKNFDAIVLNDLSDAGAGFGHTTNKVTIIEANGQQTSYPLKSKQAVAQDITHKIIQLLPKNS